MAVRGLVKGDVETLGPDAFPNRVKPQAYDQMAEIKSLGVHTPVALPYLIDEGLLPAEPSSDLYTWETYVFDDGNGDVEEEVLATRKCVVWSQGRLIRNVYHFELEGEDVIQALLTSFPSKRNVSDTRHTTGPDSANIQPWRDSRNGRKPSRGDSEATEPHSTSERALVVCLKSKAHVYFVHGTSHIVDFPFEISKAFSAPRGVILQTKSVAAPSSPPTPQLPAAPPNSFFSSQLRPTASYLQSPTLVKSFASTQPSRPSPLSGKARLDTLSPFPDAFAGLAQATDDDTAGFYSLTDPLSDLGVVTYSLQHPRPRLSTKASSGLSVEFEAVDNSERIIYVSPTDELGGTGSSQNAPLTLIITLNQDLQTLTIWHAWYVEEKSLASLLKERAAHKAAKARRRSSFMSSMGTGATTPAVRTREGVRESLVGASSLRLPGEQAPSQPHGASSRRPTRQEEEDAMASQMDPDYQPGASQQAARESRRISSMNADMRQSQYNANASFAGPGGRRNASFGGPGERRSLGHRKSRGSTPGSVFSRSLGPDDDLMDLDSSFDADDEESVGSILRHIRATFDATGAESILAGLGDEMKRELIVRKLHSIPIATSTSSEAKTVEPIQVATLLDFRHRMDNEDQRMTVFIHQDYTKEVSALQLIIKRRLLWPELSLTPTMAIPLLVGEQKVGSSSSIVKLKESGRSSILLADRGLVLAADDNMPWPLPAQAPYRVNDRRDHVALDSTPNKEVGRNRTLPGPSRHDLQLLHAGASGRFDEVGTDRVHHRRQVRFTPRDPAVSRVLDVCELVLPAAQAQCLRGIWCVAHAELVEHPERLAGTTFDRDWVAMVAALCCFLPHLISNKARAALDLANVAAGKAADSSKSRLRMSEHRHELLSNTTADWLGPRASARSNNPQSTASQAEPQRDKLMVVGAALANELLGSERLQRIARSALQLSPNEAIKLVLGLHVLREEYKLCKLTPSSLGSQVLAVTIAQIGSWLGLVTWSHQPGQYYHLEGANEDRWAFVKSQASHAPQMPLMDEPVGVYHWFEHAMNVQSEERYPTLEVIAMLDRPMSKSQQAVAAGMTGRIAALSDIVEASSGLAASPVATVELMAKHGINSNTIESLPEAIGAPFKDAIMKCERDPPTSWTPALLALVGREDLVSHTIHSHASVPKKSTATASSPHDIQTVCHALDHHHPNGRTKEASRHAVSQLIFREDKRLVEATSLMHFNATQMAECAKQPDWTDVQHIEQQRKKLQWVTTRMVALPPGDAMIHFDCQTPLLTDKYHLPGFSNSCIMQPMGTTLTTDRSGLTEEKVSWAYFHAGASAGLRISRHVAGIDTSWIAFNKPNDLTNRHAGLLLALGLNGHLRHVAKWLSFKYLTPKHTMTSVGLLLGLSASYMGTMDGLITRMLSVHITRMLPPGAAELNVSALTQTAGLIGIGLLYYNTQHRRMSEIMLSEVEQMELEDPDSGPDPLRDECYRLAAGIALGYINLGKGKDLGGLHGMYLPERLLAIAVGPRPVTVVHVFDRATAGAVVALALVYMKAGDVSIARKIDIPDTEAQFDHVRPDVLMLRVMAKHLIMWDGRESHTTESDRPGFIRRNLPACYQRRFQAMSTTSAKLQLQSSDVPYFNVVTGLAWVLSLMNAGSGNTKARDEILTVLNYFHAVRSGAEAYYYDAKLARSTVRRCIDVLALSAATVMAGTGDLKTFRYLRRLHGRTDSETQYGSHLAAHLAIGVLFLGGGTYTFGTSNLAIASLICAFYPLFPTDVHDNRVHLQALRHFWVFAAEARCLIVEEIDTHRPVSMPITLTLRDGTVKSLTAPCLLPELDSIATVQTNDRAYWRVTLDFAGNAEHLAAFRQNQRILVRQCPASEAHDSVFSSALAALNPSQANAQRAADLQKWQDVLTSLPVFDDHDKADVELVLPPNANRVLHTDERGTVIDDRVALSRSVAGSDGDALWNLRVLFAWAQKARDSEQGGLKWLGDEVVEGLRAKIEERMRQT
ncbi:Anaphase-promoting complex subunit 1 [Saxophila tyrrhenica]|uniref:Anaphase-promoting complex subunit 1 n=1 Tax=Saxophila tyrrhenica TaxID=1690608 RepID=A0AAV9PJX4_9PEZI|nr:Anaphase-promoting complex subunit 1 [Saxophila tyrrhenica]